MVKSVTDGAWVMAEAYPAEMLDACQQAGVPPEALLDWSVSKDRVTLVLKTGEKFTFAVLEPWRLPLVEPPAVPVGVPAGEKKRRQSKLIAR